MAEFVEKTEEELEALTEAELDEYLEELNAETDPIGPPPDQPDDGEDDIVVDEPPEEPVKRTRPRIFSEQPDSGELAKQAMKGYAIRKFEAEKKAVAVGLASIKARMSEEDYDEWLSQSA